MTDCAVAECSKVHYAKGWCKTHYQRQYRRGGWAYYSLDRIDNDRGYEPGNVRWATSEQQATNKRGYGDFESRRDATTGRFV